MKIGSFQIAFALVLAVVAGGLGAFAANEWRANNHPQTLHDFVHEELQLDASQNAQLDKLEAQFKIERKELELSLRAANARLAAAMEEEHSYGPKVAAAIDQVHARMGDLQKATVKHVFAMRALLNARQKKLFDRQVASSLTAPPAE